MSPKPIVRKTGGESNLPPLETMISPFSAKMAEMAKAQNDAFAQLSNNGQTMYSAIRDLDRYDALTDADNGMIVMAKQSIANYTAKMVEAVSSYKSLMKRVMAANTFDASGKSTRAPDADSKLLLEALTVLRSLAHVGGELANQCHDLAGFEAEVVVLEPKVMSDASLPDFEAMKDQSKKDEFDAASQKAADFVAGMSGNDVVSGSETPQLPAVDQTVIQDPRDLPLIWRSFYECRDTVVAPNKEGARALIAMRISKTLKAEDINVWLDEKDAVAKTEPQG